MSGTATAVDAIVCTTCEASRADSLWRAVYSLLTQEGAAVRVLVVANGPRVEPSLAEALAARPGVRVIRQEEGSLPLAIETGRRAVTAPFFAFLDDDDIYLPGALRLRLERMAADDAPDVVATDGFSVRPDGSRRRMIGAMDRFQAAPLASLAAANWLSSCGGLYRTETVGETPFTAVPRYFEWTGIAFRLAHAGQRIGFVDAPTFAVTETPGSLSRSLAYHTAAPDFVRGLLRHDMPPPARRAFRRKLIHLEHVAAELHLRGGDRRAALSHHLLSLASPYGLRRNASFTWRLLTGLPSRAA